MTWSATYFSAPWWTCRFHDDDVGHRSCHRREGELTFPGPALDSVIADASVHCHGCSFYITNSEDAKYSLGVGGRGLLPTTTVGDRLVNLGI